jgi:hypothetical protein
VVIVSVIVGLGLLAVGIAGVLGWLPDTRDAEYGLGRVLATAQDPSPEAMSQPAPSAPSV